MATSVDAWEKWRSTLSPEAQESLVPRPATPVESPVGKRTRRVSEIPKSLRSHVPSATEKCKAEAHCRMCGRSDKVRPITLLTQHHIVPQEWWKHVAHHERHVRNANANVLPLCRPCHDEIHSLDPTVRLPARSMLRRTFTQKEIAFVIACVGQPWLDKHYPLTWIPPSG